MATVPPPKTVAPEAAGHVSKPGPTSHLSNASLPSTYVNDRLDTDSAARTDATVPTASDVWGPFFVRDAPFRIALAPVWADASVGAPVVIKGTVFGLQSKKPLPFATLDLWQAFPAGENGEYDYFEPDGKEHPYVEEINMHGAAKEYAFRARGVTDHNGRYEVSTIMPPPYFDPDDKIAPWRTSHVHFWVNKPGYTSLVTQMYFAGQELNKLDTHIQEATTVQFTERMRRVQDKTSTWLEGTFDIVLAEQPE